MVIVTMTMAMAMAITKTRGAKGKRREENRPVLNASTANQYIHHDRRETGEGAGTQSAGIKLRTDITPPCTA
eukprot:7752633-Pyramimonas_sp.AAC.1